MATTSRRSSKKSGDSSFHITGSEVESLVPDAKSFEIESNNSYDIVQDYGNFELENSQKKNILA